MTATRSLGNVGNVASTKKTDKKAGSSSKVTCTVQADKKTDSSSGRVTKPTRKAAPKKPLTAADKGKGRAEPVSIMDSPRTSVSSGTGSSDARNQAYWDNLQAHFARCAQELRDRHARNSAGPRQGDRPESPEPGPSTSRPAVARSPEVMHPPYGSIDVQSDDIDERVRSYTAKRAQELREKEFRDSVERRLRELEASSCRCEEEGRLGCNCAEGIPRASLPSQRENYRERHLVNLDISARNCNGRGHNSDNFVRQGMEPGLEPGPAASQREHHQERHLGHLEASACGCNEQGYNGGNLSRPGVEPGVEPGSAALQRELTRIWGSIRQLETTACNCDRQGRNGCNCSGQGVHPETSLAIERELSLIWESIEQMQCTCNEQGRGGCHCEGRDIGDAIYRAVNDQLVDLRGRIYQTHDQVDQLSEDLVDVAVQGREALGDAINHIEQLEHENHTRALEANDMLTRISTLERRMNNLEFEPSSVPSAPPAPTYRPYRPGAGPRSDVPGLPSGPDPRFDGPFVPSVSSRGHPPSVTPGGPSQAPRTPVKVELASSPTAPGTPRRRRFDRRWSPYSSGVPSTLVPGRPEHVPELGSPTPASAYPRGPGCVFSSPMTPPPGSASPISVAMLPDVPGSGNVTANDTSSGRKVGEFVLDSSSSTSHSSPDYSPGSLSPRQSSTDAPSM